MTEAALFVAGAGWLRLLAGTAVFLLPGVAAADRLFPRRPSLLVLAPVLSLTLLTLAAILFDLLFQVPLHGAATASLALALAALLARPRIEAALRRAGAGQHARGTGEAAAPPDAAAEGTGAKEAATGRHAAGRAGRRRLWRPAWTEAAGLAAALLLVVLVQHLPHLPGDASPGAAAAYPELAQRVLGGLRGEDNPYPVHVDEHHHMALQGELGRTGSVAIGDPFTGRPEGFSLLSVQGLRQERGFDVGVLQALHLTGVPQPALVRFLPALWSGVVAAGLWAVLRPAPGAVAAAAFLAAVPTTVRLLGPGFLVPSAFALAWIPLTLAVALKADGGRRTTGMLLAVTGAAFQHLVLGTLCIALGVLATLLRPGRRSDRLALLAATLLPLLWILPLLWDDVASAVRQTHQLPFEQQTFLLAGLPFYGAALAGAAFAWARAGPERVPHRVLSLLMLAIVVSLVWSVQTDHRSDATYSRLVPTFFVCAAALAGLGVGEAAAWAAASAAAGSARLASRLPATWTGGLGAGVAALAVVVLLAPAVDGNQHDRFYRVFDAASWQDVEVLAEEAGPGDVVLMHPWQAPVANALSGARPHAVLYPGQAPRHGADWDAYLAGEADEAWLEERGITVVAGDRPPPAPHTPLGARVYRTSPPLPPTMAS